MPSGLGWRGQRKGLLSPLGSHGASPNLLCLHPHSPGSAPQLDGNAFSASMAPRATCSAWLGRRLVLLPQAPGWRGWLRVVGWGGPEGAGPPLDSGEGPPPGATETHLRTLTSLPINPPSAWHPQPAPHLPGHRGGRRGALERDRLSKQLWDLGHGTPAEPQCPCLQSGENEGSLPTCLPPPTEEPCPRKVPGHCHSSLPTPLIPLLGWAPGHSGRQQS